MRFFEDIGKEMRIRKSTGQESCTNCRFPWEASLKYPTLCNNCFCPDVYCTLVDDIGWYQSGLFGDILSPGVLAEIKKMIEDQVAISVVPVTWEELCQRQPQAKILFD